MSRHKIVDGIKVDFTDSENSERDAEEAQVASEYADYVANNKYKDDRASSYPPIGDQLDALWKGGDDADAMKVLVNKVKSDFPKPD